MAIRLETFEVEAEAASDLVVTDATAIENGRLASYEEGYSAGWEDAVKAQAADQARLQSDLSRNMQALGFTFHEARMHVLRAMEPLMEALIGRILPEMARETLAPVALETLMPLAEQMADAPVTILVNPSVRPEIEALLGQATGLPLSLVDEPSLGDGQVSLRLGGAETRVDLHRAVNEIAGAVRSFFDLDQKEIRHG
ncbi:flagellar biosynthesis protein [Cereibacter azotoformans]|uniref:flagellar biosynthesis protein n=1 Tax=Cereibacter azotoformans TaxID=43057 RepID=UPI001EEA4DCB|nr:flagellar biosynthesis protein [Cereibacter azotoformans]ULB11105.1 flagellar biosynthesis protein [Cereibacter azotoformans]